MSAAGKDDLSATLDRIVSAAYQTGATRMQTAIVNWLDARDLPALARDVLHLPIPPEPSGTHPETKQ